ncbi:hypothetical protein D3C86_1630540 [compost metagenome]
MANGLGGPENSGSNLDGVLSPASQQKRCRMKVIFHSVNLVKKSSALMTMSCWMSVKIKKLHIVGILPMIFEKNQLQYKISY